mmetsp:Transcript_6587/g.11839  ORF Transcript_6587/g.11839 Transcript_6587/m.11839 type:complete len:640 (-) Transcript_6587:518-2437(-)
MSEPNSQAIHHPFHRPPTRSANVSICSPQLAVYHLQPTQSPAPTQIRQRDDASALDAIWTDFVSTLKRGPWNEALSDSGSDVEEAAVINDSQPVQSSGLKVSHLGNAVSLYGQQQARVRSQALQTRRARPAKTDATFSYLQKVKTRFAASCHQAWGTPTNGLVVHKAKPATAAATEGTKVEADWTAQEPAQPKAKAAQPKAAQRAAAPAQRPVSVPKQGRPQSNLGSQQPLGLEGSRIFDGLALGNPQTSDTALLWGSKWPESKPRRRLTQDPGGVQPTRVGIKWERVGICVDVRQEPTSDAAMSATHAAYNVVAGRPTGAVSERVKKQRSRKEKNEAYIEEKLGKFEDDTRLLAFYNQDSSDSDDEAQDMIRGMISSIMDGDRTGAPVQPAVDSTANPSNPEHGLLNELDQKKEDIAVTKGPQDKNPRLKLRKRMQELRKAMRQTDDPKLKKKMEKKLQKLERRQTLLVQTQVKAARRPPCPSLLPETWENSADMLHECDVLDAQPIDPTRWTTGITPPASLPMSPTGSPSRHASVKDKDKGPSSPGQANIMGVLHSTVRVLAGGEQASPQDPALQGNLPPVSPDWDLQLSTLLRGNANTTLTPRAKAAMVGHLNTPCTQSAGSTNRIIRRLQRTRHH